MPSAEELLTRTWQYADSYLLLQEGPATLGLALCAVIIAMVIGDRMTLLRAFLLGLFAVWTTGSGSAEIGAAVGAFAVFHALCGMEKQLLYNRLLKIEDQVAFLGSTVGPFIEALDKRSRQIDLMRPDKSDQNIFEDKDIEIKAPQNIEK